MQEHVRSDQKLNTDTAREYTNDRELDYLKERVRKLIAYWESKVTASAWLNGNKRPNGTNGKGAERKWNHLLT